MMATMTTREADMAKKQKRYSIDYPGLSEAQVRAALETLSSELGGRDIEPAKGRGIIVVSHADVPALCALLDPDERVTSYGLEDPNKG